MDASDEVTFGVECLNINSQQEIQPSNCAENDILLEKWKFSLPELYKISLKFFKEKEGKAFHLTYQEKMKMVALTKQIGYGKYNPQNVPDVGFLDVVGNDRRQAWKALGDMSAEKAMLEFVEQLHSKSDASMFEPYLQAVRTELESAHQNRLDGEQLQKTEDEKRRLVEEEAERLQQQEKEMQIRGVLNQQTAAQFRQYVQQQYPYNVQLQDALVEHLQEQHYQQYMQQVLQQQMAHQKETCEQLQVMQRVEKMSAGESVSSETPAPGDGDGMNEAGDTALADGKEQEYALASGGDEDCPPLAAASMWTRKELKEFRNSLHKDKESVLKIGSGETATVRVPTHENGTCLFWEFATDNHDIGFGVYFEWTISPSNMVSVHVSDSSDEEEFEEEEERIEPSKGDDVEKGGKSCSNKPPTDEIIPVYRRDSHEEVYCGSHMYPGQGVYLLKFDNSYSLWRSKTVYYRIYYSQ